MSNPECHMRAKGEAYTGARRTHIRPRGSGFEAPDQPAGPVAPALRLESIVTPAGAG
jgi:hypothetical protein